MLAEGDNLTAERIAEEMQKYDSDFTVQKISELKKLNIDLVSLDKLAANNDIFKFSSYLKDTYVANPLEVAEKEQQSEVLKEFLNTNLDADELKIVEMYYGLNGGKYSVDEIIEEHLLDDQNKFKVTGQVAQVALEDMKKNKDSMGEKAWEKQKSKMAGYVRRKISKSIRKLKTLAKKEKYRMSLGLAQ